MTVMVLGPELVAPVASMLAAAWAGGGTLAPAPDRAPGVQPVSEDRSQGGGVSADEGREQGLRRAPGADGGDLCAAVDAGPGPLPHRVHHAAVHPGRGGVAAGLACQCHRGDRLRPGISGRSTEGRDGFKALVARVCLGEVGAIFGLEVSRLARSADLSRLLELGRLTDTLVIDADGIYDLAEFNDRLLLGLN